MISQISMFALRHRGLTACTGPRHLWTFRLMMRGEDNVSGQYERALGTFNTMDI